MKEEADGAKTISHQYGVYLPSRLGDIIRVMQSPSQVFLSASYITNTPFHTYTDAIYSRANYADVHITSDTY